MVSLGESRNSFVIFDKYVKIIIMCVLFFYFITISSMKNSENQLVFDDALERQKFLLFEKLV